MDEQQLAAALALTTPDNDGWNAGADDDRRYFDWSGERPDGLTIEVGDADGDVAQVDMSWAEIEQLHQALTHRILRYRQWLRGN